MLRSDIAFSWEPATSEDEWKLPRWTLLFGGESGESGESGGGPGPGDGGGFESGGATTGGGDWGSSGSYDASGFNAAGPDAYSTALSNSPGGYYDTGGAGIAPGALGAEYGGAFGLSGISGQPGTNAFGAELDAGGGGYSGVGNAINSWAMSTVAGPPGAGSFADLSGGGFSGYTGYSNGGYEVGGGYQTGGGGYEVGGGGFGGYQAGGSPYSGGLGGYQTGGGFQTGGPGAGTYGLGIGSEGGQAGGGSGYESGYGEVGGEPSGGPSDIGGDAGGGPASSDNLGAPAPSGGPADTSSEDAPSADAPSAADTPAVEEATGSPAGQPTQAEEATGSPAGLPTQAEPASGSPAGQPTQAEEVSGSPAGLPTQADDIPSTQDQTGFTTNWGGTPDYQGAPYADFGQGASSVASQAWDSVVSTANQAWDSVMSAITPTDNPNESLIESLTNPYNPGNVPSPDVTNPNTYLSQATQQALQSLFGGAFQESTGWVNSQSPMGMPWGSNYGGPFGGPDVVGDRASQGVNWGSVFEGAAAQPSVDWGSVFEGAQTQDPVAPSIESFIPGDRQTDFNYDTTNWGAVFEGAPSQQNVDWGSVFEGTPTEPTAPSIESFIPAARETDFNYQSQLPVEIVPASEVPGLANPLANPPQTEALPEINVTPNVPAVETVAEPPQQTPEVGRPQQAPEVPPQGLLETLPGAPPNAPAPSVGALPPQAPPQDAPQAPPQVPVEHEDTPEPPDTSTPQADPNAPRPPGDIPGQLRGANGSYQNAHADTPQTSRTYRDSGRTDYPQGRPGVDFRTARQAGIEAHFRSLDINTQDLDARLVERINRAIEAMPANIRDTLVASSGYRPAHREEAIEHGMDQRTSQESVYSRGNPVNGRSFPAARPGGSNHAPGRAIDFLSSPALSWLRANAGRFGLETIPGDHPHIQLQGARGNVGPRPSAQEQADQRAIDAQSRQAAIDRGLIGGRSQQAAVPLPRGRPSDAPAPDTGTVVSVPPQPPADIPPPAPVAPDVPRPPADIPAQTVPPAVAARTFQAAMQFGKFLADNLAKSGALPTNREEGQKALNALAHELARAGYPASVAQRTILETATQGSIKAGYGPNSNYNLLGHVTQAINEMAATAMQGYRTGKTPEAQGPPAPVAPGKRSEAPSLFQLAAGGRDVGAPPAIDPGQQGLPGRAEGEAPLEGGIGQNLDPFGLLGPLDPRSGTVLDPDNAGRGRVIDPDIQRLQREEQDLHQQQFDPRGWRDASLLDLLSNFNPISTAEARGGRSQAGNLMAPRADPGVIQGRLAEARSAIIDDLQNNQGLRNTLDLVATGEVGSQGKAAVLAFLETAMNKVAAEASRQGREATGRDLLNYLNDRSYFPDTWGKIESGKIKGGVVTDDLLDAVAEGSNTTKGSTGNSSATSPGSRFGGNPTNATIGREHYGVENYSHHIAWYNALGALPAGRGIGSDFAADPQDMPASVGAMPPEPPGLLDMLPQN